MLHSAASVDLYMSGDAAFLGALGKPVPGIHWTPPAEWRANFLDLPSFLTFDQKTHGRALTAEEETLMWQSLRAGAELLYTL